MKKNYCHCSPANSRNQQVVALGANRMDLNRKAPYLPMITVTDSVSAVNIHAEQYCDWPQFHAMQGVDAVVHMVALLQIVNPPPELREKYERINVGGTARVVEAAIKAGVRRVVLFSTIAVYGPSDGCVLNEMSPTHPDTFYEQTKRAAEQIVLNARGADDQPLGTVLRLGAVYGSRIKGNYPLFLLEMVSIDGRWFMIRTLVVRLRWLFLILPRQAGSST